MCFVLFIELLFIGGSFGLFSESCSIRIPSNTLALDSSSTSTSAGLILRPVDFTLDTFWAEPLYHAQDILFPAFHGVDTAIFRSH